MNRVTRIIALTKAGHYLAKNLQQHLPAADVWYKPKPFTEKVQAAFKAGDALVMICATGIAVRTLAPVIQSKQDDPPVLVLDEEGIFIIPLLSGHEGGANDWGHALADKLGATLVITTANPYLKPVYTIGMGCERHCSQEELHCLLMNCLKEAALELEQIHSINSIDIKADELGLIALAQSLRKPYRTFDKIALAEVESQLSVKSDYIYNTVGVYGVAESAALVAAQHQTQRAAELVLNKTKAIKATCAIARSYPGT